MPAQPKRKQISPKRFAQAMLRGATWEEAMMMAGYSATVAKRGKASASRECLLEYERQSAIKLDQLKKTGLALTPDERKQLVRGKLVQNVVEGRDESTQSLKMLGQDREVGMFQSEAVSGFFVIEVPANLMRDVSPRVIDGEPDRRLWLKDGDIRDSHLIGSGRPEDRGTGLTTTELETMRAEAAGPTEAQGV